MKGSIVVPKYRKITSSRIDQMLKKGRGQGKGNSYKPWISIRDVPSNGYSHRIKGWKTNRVHHLLSNIELALFYMLEWQDSVIDIREKFPLLPIETTFEIAEETGIKHPFDRDTKEPIVLTTDFLATIRTDNNDVEYLAFNVMPQSRKQQKRTLERAVIEKLYWKRKGVKFRIVTDMDIPYPFINNMEWLHQSKNLDYSPGISIKDVILAENLLFTLIQSNRVPLRIVCSIVDKELGFNKGASLWIVQYLIANKYWSIDIFNQIDTSKPLEFKRDLEKFYLNYGVKEELLKSMGR